jgi:hypothetical protein
LNLTGVLPLSSIILGIGHLYQGAAGAGQTAVIGFCIRGGVSDDRQPDTDGRT